MTSVMKYLMMAAALTLLSACGKGMEEPAVGVEPTEDETPVEVVVGIDYPDATKAPASDALTEGESKVNSIQVFVFKPDGTLDGHARQVSGDGKVTVAATAGARLFRAVVNDPEDVYATLSDNGKKTFTETEFLSARHRLEDNRPGNFVMQGTSSVTLVENCDVQVEVKRAACRIELQKISASLRDFRRNWSVSINSMFLANVAADEDFGYSGTPTIWANQLGWKEGYAAYDELLYDKLYGVSVKNNIYEKDGERVAEEDAYRVGVTEYDLAPGVKKVKDNGYKVSHVWYPYPNSAPADYSPEWSPRSTLLVIEATMIEDDGATPHHGWYVITLPKLLPNYKYTIQEVMLMHAPGSNPYTPIFSGQAVIKITVEPWEIVNMNDIML